MTFMNFALAGTMTFSSTALIEWLIADTQDTRQVLDIQEATGELLGYFENGQYDESGKGNALLRHPPLRTAHASFPASGSSK